MGLEWGLEWRVELQRELALETQQLLVSLHLVHGKLTSLSKVCAQHWKPLLVIAKRLALIFEAVSSFVFAVLFECEWIQTVKPFPKFGLDCRENFRKRTVFKGLNLCLARQLIMPGEFCHIAHLFPAVDQETDCLCSELSKRFGFFPGKVCRKVIGSFSHPASLVVAAKFLDDFYCRNAYFAAVGDMPLKQLNELELRLCFLLDFDLNVTKEEFGTTWSRLSLDTCLQASPSTWIVSAESVKQNVLKWPSKPIGSLFLIFYVYGPYLSQ